MGFSAGTDDWWWAKLPASICAHVFFPWRGSAWGGVSYSSCRRELRFPSLKRHREKYGFNPPTWVGSSTACEATYGMGSWRISPDDQQGYLATKNRIRQSKVTKKYLLLIPLHPLIFVTTPLKDCRRKVKGILYSQFRSARKRTATAYHQNSKRF